MLTKLFIDKIRTKSFNDFGIEEKKQSDPNLKVKVEDEHDFRSSYLVKIGLIYQPWDELAVTSSQARNNFFLSLKGFESELAKLENCKILKLSMIIYGMEW